jgi:hypothetical protein
MKLFDRLISRLVSHIDQHVANQIEQRAVKALVDVIRYDDRVSRIDVKIARTEGEPTELHMTKEAQR